MLGLAAHPAETQQFAPGPHATDWKEHLSSPALVSAGSAAVPAWLKSSIKAFELPSTFAFFFFFYYYFSAEAGRTSNFLGASN